MSKEFGRKYPRSRDCHRCGRCFTNKGIKKRHRGPRPIALASCVAKCKAMIDVL